MSVPDIVLFPHCDLHVALHGTPDLFVRVMLRRNKQPGDPDQDPMSFMLVPVTNQCVFEFFAPFNAVGSRLNNVPSIDANTGRVTATTPGVYLFQVRVSGHYLVGRLQVHDAILGWWFGNSSITTAVDTRFAHAQPSIYASFTADVGTDPVGDITGHGYVPLTSASPAVVVSPEGRLRGVTPGPGSVDVSGTFLGTTHTLPVRVVDYGLARNQLDTVRVADMANAGDIHNMLFIAEGFRDTDADRKTFDEIVTKVADEMFTKPRHQPYPLLQGSINVWKAYMPSQQHVMTCAYHINELPSEGNVLPAGYPIPYNGHPKGDTTKYTVEELVRRVGLPLSNQTGDRTALVPLWTTQNLDDFNAAKVDDDLIKAWKAEKTTGILEARDTFLGFKLGARPADRLSGVDFPPVSRPAADNGNAALRAFVKRVYEFYAFYATRLLLMDPRRHPPELFVEGDTSPGNAVLRYVAGLHARSAPNPNIGAVWQPDPTGLTFRRSRGFVAVIAHEGLHGGANLTNSTMTSTTLSSARHMRFAVVPSGQERVMRRTPPDVIPTDVDEIINTVAHEFGHSFNLLDEYEDYGGPDGGADFHVDHAGDNITRLGFIFANGTVDPLTNRVHFNDLTIDVNKVKWLSLMRMQRSDVLIKNAELVDQVIKLTIDKRFISGWVKAKKDNLRLFLRAPDITPLGQQLPLQGDPTHFLADLEIGAIDEALGTILLAATGLPPIGSPVFQRGAVLFVPRRRPAPDLRPLLVVEQEVLDFLTEKKTPLNDDTNTANVNKDEDDPMRIPQFAAPCKAYTMIGVYEGANQYAAQNYRPAGLCKMRKASDAGTGDGEFCHVCKWLIVNRVNPGLHAILDDGYFPAAKGRVPDPII
jgi:hypothetical protein